MANKSPKESFELSKSNDFVSKEDMNAPHAKNKPNIPTPLDINHISTPLCPVHKIALLNSPIYTSVLHSLTTPIHGNRDIFLASLLNCCGLSQNYKSSLPFLHIIPPKKATLHHLLSFHTQPYLYILQFTTQPPLSTLQKYNLVDDCPLLPNLFPYIQHTAGASIHAAHLLQKYQVAINWGGGRHHAHPDSASGFCYVNDVVLAIQRLLQNQKKVFYVDIDVHHGDGVQNAFYETDRVMCISFHRFEKGFFPYPDGDKKQRGKGLGLGYNWNIPLPKNCSDVDFLNLYCYTIEKFHQVYQFEVLVMCVGTDGLKNDPLLESQNVEGWKLTPDGIAECVRWTADFLAKNGVKLLLLGGGGYDPARAALTYLLCTAAACEGAKKGLINMLPKDVPQHQYFEKYGPTWKLRGSLSRCDDMLKKEEGDYKSVLMESRKAVDLAGLFMNVKKEEELGMNMRDYMDGGAVQEEDWEMHCVRGGNKKRSKRRRRKECCVEEQNKLVKNESM